MNVWPDAEESHATVKVFLLENAAGKNEKEINEDGSLKVTAVNSKHDRYAVYFTDASKPMAVRIEVTSENGEKSNYYLVISKKTSEEEGKTLLEKLRSENALANQAAADAVREKIAAIGSVTLESKSAIEAARAAYDALTEEQKSLVENEEALFLAEAALNALQEAADKAAANQAAADAVREKIAAIGSVTLESKSAIEAARTAYDALTEEQKALVKNLDILMNAEKVFADLLKPIVPTIPPTGDATPLTLYAALATFSLLGLMVLLSKKEKHAE